MKINERFDPESLKSVFQTPNPGYHAIIKWQRSWKENPDMSVKADSYENISEISRLLLGNNFDPLFYQFKVIDKEIYVVFYNDEDRAFFKILN